MTQQADETDVRVKVTLDAPPHRAFTVFTEHCDEWWPRMYRLGAAERTDLRIERRAGGRWYETTADGGQCDWGRVLSYQPSRRLTLSWQIGVGFAAEPDPDRASRVDVRFAGDATVGTEVTLVHSELPRLGEGWESMRDSVAARTGWPGILQAYRTVASMSGGLAAGSGRRG